MAHVFSHLKGHGRFTAGLCIFSTLCGGLLGAWGEMFYMWRDESRAPIGWLVGIISGLLVGIFYCMNLFALLDKGKCGSALVAGGILWGMLCGVVSSTIVHVLLMIWYRENAIAMLILGGVFGLLAGLILGGVSAKIVAGDSVTPPNDPATVGEN